jgi:imidazole glycerol-phosphate synthase subunit HisH
VSAAAERVVRVAIVDYGMGNLFSVRRACEAVDLPATVTDDAAEVLSADGVILPGVGAFGEAMATLGRRGLDDALREVASSGRPLLGICLGMQLFADRSEEFGNHEGLGIVPGSVRRLPRTGPGVHRAKLPHIGWSAITPRWGGAATAAGDDPAHVPGGGAAWSGTLLDGLQPGVAMYFVHSYALHPDDTRAWRAGAAYGDVEFCAALETGHVSGCQFHPERSGQDGIGIYRSFARRVRASAAESAR